MAEIPAQNGSTVCVICFWMKRPCMVEGKPCCSGTSSHPSLPIAEDLFGSGIIAKIRSLSETQQTGLAFTTNSNCIFECQPAPALSIIASYNFKLGGTFNISNHDLVAQSDRMVVDTWAPKIRAKDGAIESIPLACLGIGYCNMLVFANFQDDSKPPFDKHDFSPVFTELAIMRINELTISPMNLIRKVQHKLDEESRSWLILWYLYSSILHAKLEKMGRCKLLDNSELFRHIQEIFVSFRKELRAFLAADCPNRVKWVAAFEDSQRSLVRKLQTTDFGTLYVKLVEWPQPPLGFVHYDPPRKHQTNYQFTQPSSTDHQVESFANEMFIDPLFSTEWAVASLPIMSDLIYDELPVFSGFSTGTGDVGFDQGANMDIEDLATQDDLRPCDLHEDHMGAYDTLF